MKKDLADPDGTTPLGLSKTFHSKLKKFCAERDFFMKEYVQKIMVIAMKFEVSPQEFLDFSRSFKSVEDRLTKIQKDTVNDMQNLLKNQVRNNQAFRGILNSSLAMNTEYINNYTLHMAEKYYPDKRFLIHKIEEKNKEIEALKKELEELKAEK